MMTKLQRIEKQINEHRQSNCAACTKSVTDVSAPTCPVMLELNQQARAAAKKARR